MIATIIRLIFNLLNLVILIDIVVSFFLSPYHPIRNALDSIVNPLLNPIRKILPQTGMLDFSPIVLILILQLLEYIILIPFK
jgi:YggT family protein